MERKTSRLTLLIDPHKKAAFELLCAQQDRTASQVVRQLIRDYLAAHGVAYEAAAQESEMAQAAEQPGAAPDPSGPASGSTDSQGAAARSELRRR